MASGIEKRRSSIKNLGVQEELRNLVPQEAFRTCHELQNIQRLSGNAARNSHIRALPIAGSSRRPSGIPTPQQGSSSRVGSGSRSTGRVNVGPRNSAARGRQTTSNTNRGSVMHMKPPVLPSRPSANVSYLSSTFNNTRRKSKSYDSLMNTPAFTPGTGRSRSKSPGGMSSARRRGVLNEGGDQSKNIKINKDKKVQSDMARYVFEFLEAQECEARPPKWSDLITAANNVSVLKYYCMIKFLASHIVGESYFAKSAKPDPKEDDAEKVMELTKLLKYPGALIKSHIKTATAQHAWPSCLAFMAWLCARVQAMLNPPAEPVGITELANNGMREFSLDSYIALFPKRFRNDLTKEDVDAELETFKARVQDSNTVELPEGTRCIEDLKQERDKEKAELESLQNEPDPAKELKERLSKEMELQRSMQDKIRETEIQCKNYSDTNHITIQQERIEIEIQAKKSEIARLKTQVKSQGLSQRDASALIKATEALKDQLEAIIRVNTQLQGEKESRSIKVEKTRKDLYEMLPNFGIVEKYNEIVRFLKLKNLEIKANPFNHMELENWMKEASKTLCEAEMKVNEIAHHVIVGTDSRRKETDSIHQEIESLTKEKQELSSKLKAIENYLGCLSAEYNQKYNDAQNHVSELNEELQRALAELKNLFQRKAALGNEHKKWSESVREYAEEVEQVKKEKMEELEKFRMDFLDGERFIQLNQIALHNEERDFFLKNFGIDISADEDEDSDSPSK